MKTALGLMSGTSMDGIDVALIRSDGDRLVEFGPTLSVAYPAAFKRRIEQGLADAQELLVAKDRLRRPGTLAALEQEITTWHGDAVATFLKRECITAAQIDLLGFHGQTIIHRPENALTVQLGDGPRLARLTGIATVYDMRARDMEFGGQGAPLVPVFHQALARTVGIEGEEPIVFVNIGGISNVTYIDGDADPTAFDSGPGNALIDQWVQKEGGIPYDHGGRIASEGGVSTAIVGRYLVSPFFKRPGPKSLDRSDFAPLSPGELDLSDGARTLAHISAAAIARAAEYFPRTPKRWILCGGGRLNATLVADLRVLIQPTGGEVLLAEDVGLDGDMLEAQAFGYLAIRSAKGLPLTFPTTTGCERSATGGRLAELDDLA